MIDFGHGVRLDTIDQYALDTLREWRNDTRINRWCRQTGLIDEEQQRAWNARRSQDPSMRMYAVIATENYTVGVCGFTGIDHLNRRAEFSLYIGPEYQGNGHGVGALKTLFTHGFRDLNLNVIWGEMLDTNPAAILFEAVGMTRTGIMPEFYFKEGRYWDAIHYCVKASEWKF